MSTAAIHTITPIIQAPSAQGSLRSSGRVGGTAGGVRLTRRGRLVVLFAALTFVLVLGVVLGGVSTASQEGGQARPTEVVVVDDGDTLWGIASDIAEDGQVRPMMKDIERLNALDSPALMVGQKLRVPVIE